MSVCLSVRPPVSLSPCLSLWEGKVMITPRIELCLSRSLFLSVSPLSLCLSVCLHPVSPLPPLFPLETTPVTDHFEGTVIPRIITNNQSTINHPELSGACGHTWKPETHKIRPVPCAVTSITAVKVPTFDQLTVTQTARPPTATYRALL